MNDIDLGVMMGVFVLNAKSYNALPDDIKKVWEDSRVDFQRGGYYIASSPEKAFEAKLKERGIQFIHFEDRDKVEAKADAVWDEWAKRMTVGYDKARAALNIIFAAHDKIEKEYPNGLQPEWGDKPFPWSDPSYTIIK
jgi:TRAP-type C4-dicarboxylate transport system substrate-binding protein